MAQAPRTPVGESSLSDQPRDKVGDAAIAFGRAAWVGALSGVGVGLLMGVLNRLIMRVVAVMNGPTAIETDFGAKVLNVTLAGTIFLIIVTVIFAIVPGLLYVGLRRLLPGGVLMGGLAFGALIAAVYGSTIVDSQARDFRLLGEPMVSAAMFLCAFVIFGLLVAPLAARLDRRLAGDPSGGASFLYTVVGSLIVLVAAQGLFVGRWSWLLALPLGFALAVSAGERRGARWIDHRWLVRAGGYVALAVPFALGLTEIGQELTEIVGA